MNIITEKKQSLEIICKKMNPKEIHYIEWAVKANLPINLKLVIMHDLGGKKINPKEIHYMEWAVKAKLPINCACIYPIHLKLVIMHVLGAKISTLFCIKLYFVPAQLNQCLYSVLFSPAKPVPVFCTF